MGKTKNDTVRKALKSINLGKSDSITVTIDFGIGEIWLNVHNYNEKMAVTCYAIDEQDMDKILDMPVFNYVVEAEGYRIDGEGQNFIMKIKAERKKFYSEYVI